MDRRLRSGVAGLAVALLAGSALAADAEAKLRKGPSGNAFYDPPKKKRFPDGAGKPIWVRKATGLVPLENAASTKLLLYTSNTPKRESRSGEGGKRIAVSGSVSVPEGRPPRRGWPLITYAHGTTGIADKCAPSRNRQNGPAVPFISYVDPQLEEWLAAGYAVARTDYQGLGTPGIHPYLVGKSEGRGVIDIARAARRLGEEIGRRFLIAGHSQGGHAALFAAGAADRRAKGMKPRGTVAYAPASHLLQQARLLPTFTQPSPLSGEAILIFKGMSTVSFGVEPSALLAQQALNRFPQVNRKCLGQLQQPNSFGGVPPSELLRPDAQLRAFYRVLNRQNPDVTTSRAIFLAQGTADTTVFPFLTNALDTELNAAGNKVRYEVYPGVTHGEIVAAAEDDVLAFFRAKLPPR